MILLQNIKKNHFNKVLKQQFNCKGSQHVHLQSLFPVKDEKILNDYGQ